MQREYGRAPSGERIYGAVPENHYQTSTLIGSLGLNGQIETFIYRGGTDVAALTTYVETVLAPSLSPGEIVVWDNLPAHKSPTVVHGIEQAGCQVLFLPPYSPEMNPIEKLWSKVKSVLRSIAARTQETLIDALDSALNTITLSDIHNWFINAGYRNIHI
jgi:transposase